MRPPDLHLHQPLLREGGVRAFPPPPSSPLPLPVFAAIALGASAPSTHQCSERLKPGFPTQTVSESMLPSSCSTWPRRRRATAERSYAKLCLNNRASHALWLKASPCISLPGNKLGGTKGHYGVREPRTPGLVAPCSAGHWADQPGATGHVAERDLAAWPSEETQQQSEPAQFSGGGSPGARVNAPVACVRTTERWPWAKLCTIL